MVVRAAEWVAPEQLRLVDRDEPVAGQGQAVVEVEACGICGSDLHSFRHGLAARPGQVLGHEFSGTVVDVRGVDGVSAGDQVTVRPLIPCGECSACAEGEWQRCERGHAQNIGYGSPGAFAERVLVPRAILGRTIFQLPAGLPRRAGALAEPLAVALHAIRQTPIGSDDIVLLLGAGMIGLGVTRLLRLGGVGRLVVVDPSPLRRERALALGADQAIDPTSEDVTEVMRTITGPGGFGLGARADVVIDCAGAPDALAHALKSVRQGGVVILAAVYGREVPLRPDRIMEKELEVRGSFAYKDEFPEVIAMLASGDLDALAFVSHTFALDQIDEAFRVQMDPRRSLKVLVEPGGLD